MAEDDSGNDSKDLVATPVLKSSVAKAADLAEQKVNPPKRMLSGHAYLEFLRSYNETFKPSRTRVKITGKFIF